MSRTDRLSADIERGFQALEEGRLEDAAASATHPAAPANQSNQ